MALKLIRLLEMGSCKPNAVMDGTIIDSLCKGLVDDAVCLLSETRDKGMRPDVIIAYNSLIQGLCNFNRWRETKQLVQEMENMKIRLNHSNHVYL